MILYKNVDICDLDSITTSGVLSIDECQNHNWREGMRANNATNVVYLFQPTGAQNSFTQYGAALLEVDAEATENEMLPGDHNRGKYREFVTRRIEPSEITRIFIPGMFRERVNLPASVLAKTCWCDVHAELFAGIDGNGKSLYRAASAAGKTISDYLVCCFESAQ